MATAKSRVPAWLPTILIVVIGAFMSILDTSIVNIAIPTIMDVFGTSTHTAEWVITIYMLMEGVVIPASAWLGDRFGAKKVYLFALFLFTVSSALCGLSWNIGSLIFFRVMQAAGGGLIMPTTMTILYQEVPRERIGVAMGLWGVAAMAAPTLGPTVGGYLVSYVDWRLIFYVNLPVGIAGFLLALALLPEHPPRGAVPFDLFGFLLSAAGLFGLLLALSQGNSWGWTSAPIVLLLWGSGFALLLFVLWSLDHPHPLLDLSVFRHGAFSLSMGISVLLIAGLYAGVFFVPLYLQMIRGFSALQAGLMTMPMGLATAFLMPVSGFLYDRLGPRRVALVGLLAFTLSSWLLSRITLQTSTDSILLWMMVRGAGMGLSMMPIMTAGMSHLQTWEVGRASAINNILQRVSGSFGLAAFTFLFTNRETARLRDLANGLTPMRGAFLPTYGPYVGQVGQAGLGSATGAVSLQNLLGALSRQAFVDGMHHIFLLVAGLTAITFILGFFLRRGARAGFAPME